MGGVKTFMTPTEALARESEFIAGEKDRAGLSLADGGSVQEEIEIGVQRVADEIERRFLGEKIVLCGILKGAFIFITDLCRRLKRPYSVYFVEASSYVGQKQSAEVELLSRIVPSKFAGRKASRRL
ncbi:hypothetical protein EMIHUDRAFT_248517 [Emiliania huxleyi CCMP1516]|uniref:Phosphoribosyltransferase domain-containing protein n=2 Tax=Emiliania huxleyi TaxID=2903 RepID=A0A0D3IFU4_EMIH1|nr:hypothetical protein EMIHUDRAFT_248517 [Emiliania huxleyi CCMP1516]EOD10129.1 hypothetical protein EMIHUDRAFT_248517 [Emiliania huxleyi CCMP1516]|eukprot:XP_005762558.1 hypothetical protein EMIHUDRAFT_248517 [Emiliania huxleyi CCMP1516]